MNNTPISHQEHDVVATNIFIALWQRFYPLAITDFAMTLGDTFRPMAMARLPNSEICLAAVGVVKSIALFLESPIIMTLHASTVLSSRRDSHAALLRFVFLLAGILTSIFLVIGFEPIYGWLFHDLFGVSHEVSQLAQIPFLLMVPWPALIAIRRFYQGLLVRGRKEKAMATAGVLRFIFTIASLWLGVNLNFDGSIVASISLVGAVFVEAIAVLYFARSVTINYEATSTSTKLPTTLPSVAAYYAPLGSTAMIVWGSRALMIAIIARGQDSILGIAVWTAASGLVLPIANATRMVQQIVISSPNVSSKILLQFSFMIGLACTLPLLFFGYTNAGTAILSLLLGELSSIAIASRIVIEIFFLFPLLTALQNSYQGFCLLAGWQWWVNFATIVNALLSLLLATTLITFDVSGSASAAIAMMIGLSVEVILLMVRLMKKI